MKIPDKVYVLFTSYKTTSPLVSIGVFVNVDDAICSRNELQEEFPHSLYEVREYKLNGAY